MHYWHSLLLNSSDWTKPTTRVNIFTFDFVLQRLLPYPLILTLNHQFSSLFQTPTALPPSCTTNHSIHLSPHSSPINVHPYRYPHFQKQEIESQVSCMLQHGIIRPSTSPFSSSVLLVKKRNDTWRFCVDYRALNVITIKDHFPISTVDELLDELGGARWLLKLDLLQGYH